ncbi:YccF domain-containing protein [Glycomyces paridis]|uniref:YccF domain-containing protein n=1 Tax=Glycomyces paridis TaxID=2126555 RepID=A0A4V4HPD9_9ACTN|nr:YccF domain-containing protein [Glycomyces paridis]THV29596.1 YccF domain-containing protein [Glycomyces paridis]
MSTILNVIWFVLAGLWLAIGYFVAGLVFCIFIVTIPFGIANMRLAGYVLWPFGRTVVYDRSAGCLSLVGNILWLILFGWELALAHLVTGLVQAITIIGLPLAVANWKMIPLALWPMGARVVDRR